MSYNKLRQQTTAVARILKAVANARRLAILCELNDAEKSVTELQDLIGISQSALSQHLARLRRDNLVVTRRDAQNIYYRVNTTHVPTLLGLLEELAKNQTNAMHSTRNARDDKLIAAE